MVLQQFAAHRNEQLDCSGSSNLPTANVLTVSAIKPISGLAT